MYSGSFLMVWLKTVISIGKFDSTFVRPDCLSEVRFSTHLNIFYFMNRFRLLPLFALLIAVSIIALGNKNGRASAQGKGNTGAPGDELNTNGTSKTCVNCHNAGPITASVDISLRSLNGAPVASYVPGQNYIVRVKINGTGSTIQGYGFQMIGLRSSNNTDLDGFTDGGGLTVNNYKIATIGGGRTYAEHDNISGVDTFSVRWQAPVSGTGEIKFYASGNAVNGNGGTSGDGAGIATLTVSEGTSSTDDAFDAPKLRVWPNPTAADAALYFDAPAAGTYQLIVSDLSGRIVYTQAQALAAGEQTLQLPASSWSPGLYQVQLSSGILFEVVRLVKSAN
jgi:hypothetical protein